MEIIRQLTHLNGVPIPYEAELAELKRMIDGGTKEAWAAFVALGNHSSLGAVVLLANYLQSRDVYVRRAALEAAGHNLHGKMLKEQVLNAFEDPSPIVTRAACKTAAALELERAHDRLVRLLNDAMVDNREAALKAISSLWEPSDFARVFSMFRHDHSKNLQKETAWVLFEHVTTENWKPLFKAWYKDPIPRHRAWACKIARRFGVSEFFEELRQLTNDSDGHVRKAALVALNAVENQENE